MKAADTKILKGLLSVLDQICPESSDKRFPARKNTSFSLVGVIKNKNQEGFQFTLSFEVELDKFPEIFNRDTYLKEIKDMIQKQLKKDVRYLSISWSYCDDSCCSFCFDGKLA